MSAKLLVPSISGSPKNFKIIQLEESKSCSATFLQGFPHGNGKGEPKLTWKVQVQKQLQNHRVIIYLVPALAGKQNKTTKTHTQPTQNKPKPQQKQQTTYTEMKLMA